MKELTLKQLKKLITEANDGQPKYRVQYIEGYIVKDDYKEGEIGTPDRFSIDAPNEIYDSIEDALSVVNYYYIPYKFNKGDWFYFEDGRFYSDYLVDSKEQKVSDEEIEEWKRGEKDLYTLHYDVQIIKCAKVSKEEAAAQGFKE